MASATILLQQKREQLEQEIVDFARRKEDEYKSFEQQYLSSIPNNVGFAGNGSGVPGSEINGNHRNQDHVGQERLTQRSTHVEDPALRPNAGQLLIGEEKAMGKETKIDTHAVEGAPGLKDLSLTPPP